MSLLKKLAGETAIYGISSIVGRFLSYLLVPLHTTVLSEPQYGVISQFFSYSGFVMVLFSYRMESAFFRFGTPKEDREEAYSTGMISLLASTTVIAALLLLFAQPIASVLGYADHPEYIRWFALILSFDCLTELPFARLRLEQRPIRFVSAKILNISLNVGLNLFWLMFCPWAESRGWHWVRAVWTPNLKIEYVFLANLIASAVTLLVLLPQLRAIRKPFNPTLWPQMMKYAAPLIVVTLSGMTNELFSRIMMPELLPFSKEENMAQLGIFAANYKMTMLISLFTQAYRYAAEPFFFRTAGDKDALKIQADTTKWFTVAATVGMLAVLLFMDIVKYLFLGVKFQSGIKVVPILLVANLFLGLYYNFSVWYRLKDRTMLGAWISIGGALVTVLLNIWWIPIFGYVGAAWVTFTTYAVMSFATWLTGRKHYPVPYELGTMAAYIVSALGLYYITEGIEMLWPDSVVLWLSRVLFFAGYIWFIYRSATKKK